MTEPVDMAASAFRRSLLVTSPHLTGPDVAAFQRALNVHAAQMNLDPIAADGEYGAVTASLYYEVRFRLGVLLSRTSTTRPCSASG